jgi:UV DNA damage endonuclease
MISDGRLQEAKEKIKRVWEHNIFWTQKMIDYCAENSIESYRVNSSLFPHFDKCQKIVGDISPFVSQMNKIDKRGVVLSLHPGQFVSLGTTCPVILANSIIELQYHFFISESIGFSEINIHMGGCYGDKASAKERFFNNVKNSLTPSQIACLTLENDELNYGALDIAEMCERLGTRFTFDIHHHRCYTIKEKTVDDESAFLMARKSWKGDYQRIHLSSPRDGYTTPMKSRTHSLFIQEADFPHWILKYEKVHIDVEAKAKEQAIFKLRNHISTIL